MTTARVAHATPGALYAHTADRDWECDKEMGEAAKFSKGNFSFIESVLKMRTEQLSKLQKTIVLLNMF